MELDLSNIEKNHSKHYGGRNGRKMCIILDGVEYMVKFPDRAKRNPNMSYTHDNFSEHIGCRIFQSLGIDTQDTLLIRDTHTGKVVVACKDLEQDGFVLKEFAFMKNAIIESETGGYDTELDEVLNAIDTQQILDRDKLTAYFWDMFVADALIGNTDRHNGNWSYLKNIVTGEVKLCPVYDCGSSLYSRIEEAGMDDVLGDKLKIEERIYAFPYSQIKQNHKHIRYAQFLATTDNEDCLSALSKISKHIDMQKINEIVDETPYMTDMHKIFLKTMLAERKERIIDNALANNPNIVKMSDYLYSVNYDVPDCTGTDREEYDIQYEG